MSEEKFCVKCIICNLGAVAPLQEIAAVLPWVHLKADAERELVERLEEAEQAAKAARDCLMKHLGMAALPEEESAAG